MREIKFRAWDTKENKMLYFPLGVGIHFGEDKEIDVISYGSGMNTASVHPKSNIFKLMQYIGLKDKNDKEIYEGDIIKLDDDYDLLGMNAGEVSEVYFKAGGFRMRPKYNKNARGCWIEEGEYIEVIGNIYENKELIEKWCLNVITVSMNGIIKVSRNITLVVLNVWGRLK